MRLDHIIGNTTKQLEHEFSFNLEFAATWGGYNSYHKLFLSSLSKS